MEKTTFEYIRNHKCLCLITFGLAIVGYLGHRAFIWIGEKFGIVKKVDHKSKIIKNQNQALNSPKFDNRLITKLPCNYNFFWKTLGIEWVGVDNLDDLPYTAKAALPIGWNIKKDRLGDDQIILDLEGKKQVEIKDSKIIFPENIEEDKPTPPKNESHDPSFEPIRMPNSEKLSYISYEAINDAISSWGKLDAMFERSSSNFHQHLLIIKFNEEINLYDSYEVMHLPINIASQTISFNNYITRDKVAFHVDLSIGSSDVVSLIKWGFQKKYFENSKIAEIFNKYSTYNYHGYERIMNAIYELSDKLKAELLLKFFEGIGKEFRNFPISKYKRIEDFSVESFSNTQEWKRLR